MNFCQNNAEVARVFPEQPNRQKCADLADNSASRSHVSTSLFFSPTRITRHFPLSNLKLFNTLRQCSNTMARSVWRKYRHKYMSMCGAKTSTCRYVELTKHHFLRHFLPEHVRSTPPHHQIDCKFPSLFYLLCSCAKECCIIFHYFLSEI